MTKPEYHSKITQTILNEEPPQHALSDDLESAEFLPVSVLEASQNESSKRHLWLWVLGLGILSFVLFSLYDAVMTLRSIFETSPIVSALLGLILIGFLIAILVLIVSEVKGYRSIGRLIHQTTSLEDLMAKDDKEFTLKSIKDRAALQKGSLFARKAYEQFFQSIKPHHTNAEILEIYEDKIFNYIHQEAKRVLQKESIISGGLAFVSPNNLIQSLLFLWISLRTLKRIALVYGLRPGTIGSFKLVRITLENLAAQSLMDMLTDEITNQVGSSIAGKFVENSAESVAAGALNIRLGNALIRQLQK